MWRSRGAEETPGEMATLNGAWGKSAEAMEDLDM